MKKQVTDGFAGEVGCTGAYSVEHATGTEKPAAGDGLAGMRRVAEEVENMI